MSFHIRNRGCYLQGMAAFASLAMLMADCGIAVPIPTGEKPYYDGAVPGLEIGITSKDETISEFGVPDGVYSQGSELTYIDSVENWKVLWGLILPLPGGGGGGGIETTRKRHVLSLSFDQENILTDLEVDSAGDDYGDCTSNGVCFGESDSFMRYADEAREAEAKKFPVVDDQCGIYLHGPGNQKARQVSLNGKIPVNIFSEKAFIHWFAKPGRQSITIWPEPAALDFDCQGGDVVFVHFDYRRIKRSMLELEDPVTGQNHILKKRLVLLPDGSSGLPLPPPIFQQMHDKH